MKAVAEMALVKADGTAIAKAPGSSVLVTQSETDPHIQVQVDVYRLSPYDGANFPTQERQRLFRAGQIIRQSEWDAEFTTATIKTVSPATGAAAGGTAVTVTGTGFTADAAVAVGGTACTSVVVVNATKITCVSPAKTAGTYDVTVTTAAGTATATGAFTTS